MEAEWGGATWTVAASLSASFSYRGVDVTVGREQRHRERQTHYNDSELLLPSNGLGSNFAWSRLSVLRLPTPNEVSRSAQKDDRKSGSSTCWLSYNGV